VRLANTTGGNAINEALSRGGTRTVCDDQTCWCVGPSRQAHGRLSIRCCEEKVTVVRTTRRRFWRIVLMKAVVSRALGLTEGEGKRLENAGGCTAKGSLGMANYHRRTVH